MAARAQPPHLLAGPHCNGIGKQIAVAVRVPLGGELRVLCGEIVEAREDLAVRAVGTAAPSSPAKHLCLPLVAARAHPPHLSTGANRDITGAQVAVAVRVPLGGQVGMGRGEIVEASENFAIGTVGTTVATNSVTNPCLPLVPLFTAPPDYFAATRCNIPWIQG